MTYNLPFVTWFWLFIPSALLILLSLIHYLKSRKEEQ